VQVKEIALIHAEGALAGELKHGALALVDAALPVLVIATRGAMYRKMVSVLQQLKARGARLIVICNEGDAEVPALLESSLIRRRRSNGCHEAGGAEAVRDEVLFVPQTVESLQPVVNVVPLQLLAYHITVMKGLNVDQPRNLAKSVTVTED
jgi:glutamine---fructose-6-phosphate transaminase (isomerizing)